MDVKTAEKDGIKVTIYQDELYDNSPRDCDGMMTHIFCFHSRYNIGDKHEYNSKNFGSWKEFEKQLRKDYDIVEIRPLYMYDHSGITISMGHSYPYNDRWDAGQVGFVFIDKETIRKNYGIKLVTKKQAQRAIAEMEGEVELYDEYLRGEVYGYSITKTKICPCCGDIDDVNLEGCGGFYGYDFKKNGLFDSIEEVMPEEYGALVPALIEALS
jgi:hypothetical protein